MNNKMITWVLVAAMVTLFAASGLMGYIWLNWEDVVTVETCVQEIEKACDVEVELVD